MSPIKAVIFDMDGTLIDTERVCRTAWSRASAELGAPLPDWMLHAFVGCSLPNARSMLMEEFGDEALIDAMFKRMLELFHEGCAHDLEPRDGAGEALEGLKDAGYTLALATSSYREGAVEKMKRFGFYPYFATSAFGDEIERSKPEPDIYLKTAEHLGIDPRECVAVEDSFNGVRAAHAAGMQVFMVPDFNEPTEEIANMCAGVLKSLHELPDAVEALRMS
ncbi:MAG: HAD family phosphatase [Coriobacteriaceae bacterium]|nr:HAD family phosphatase [Coriobacteriaceae bacterium]